jgi:hypothetical protein
MLFRQTPVQKQELLSIQQRQGGRTMVSESMSILIWVAYVTIVYLADWGIDKVWWWYVDKKSEGFEAEDNGDLYNLAELKGIEANCAEGMKMHLTVDHMKSDRTYINKLTLIFYGALFTMPFLLWYDWTRIARLIRNAASGMWWLLIIGAAIAGVAIGIRLSKVTYRVTQDAGVTGIPFPLILYETIAEGSNEWLDFVFPLPLTLLLFLLDICYFVLVLVAIPLIVHNITLI